ncbi:MAG: SGNH/GDSL hydrolase family protein [Lentisphaeria bacterium]|nr:SGNH/GDSL hydrolase family protein [Lentisphaeria bacterium]
MERIKAILSGSEPARWLFYGDSLTHGAKHTCGMRDYTEYFRERVLWELHRRNDLVLNSAYSGFTAADLLRDFDWRAAAFRPTAAFVMIGGNDVKKVTPEVFAEQLDELLDRFDAIGCRTVLQTPIPVLRDLDPSRARLPELAEAMRQTAARRSVPLIDHFAAWSKDPAEFYLHADELHPNGLGHIRIAHDIFKALDIFETRTSWVCRLFAPDAR